MDDYEMLTVRPAVAAQMLGISRTVLYQLMKVDGFPSFKVGTRTLIPVDGLKDWVDQQVIKQNTKNTLGNIARS